jgi:Flp pilus assembly protein TadG
MHLFLSRSWRTLRDESGQTLLLFTILLPVLFGFAAIAIDIGMLRYQEEQLQSLADAAALAGAWEISYCNGVADCTAMQTAAQQALAENGYTNVTLNKQCTGSNSATGLTLTLNNGPCALGSKDPDSGDKGSVEVVVAKEAPTYFGRILGIPHVLLSARAEASLALGQDSPFCINALDATDPGTILINGNARLVASCGAIDDSNATNALVVNGHATLETTRNNVHGTALLNGNPTVSPNVTEHAPALPDPLSYLKPPNSTGCNYSNMVINGHTSKTLGPGTSDLGLTINGNTNVTLNPGTYYFTGNFIENGNDTLTGNGVTLYFASGTLRLNGNSDANLVAPTTGEYAGILLYQNPSDPSPVILNGDTKSVFQGAIYAAGAPLYINGNGNLNAAYTILDVASVIDNGNASFYINDDYSSLPGGSPAKIVGLTE